MAVHDTIGDFLTIIRNAVLAHKKSCTVDHSKVRAAICAILKSEGYIKDFSEGLNDRGFKNLTIQLKFVNNKPAIKGIQRHSKPGRRLYYGCKDIPRVIGGLGVAILTTSKGIMQARDARGAGVGGELVCKVW